MTASVAAKFTCNVCGTVCERLSATFDREVPSCPKCASTVRLRALVALLSREIFGVELALPDFPIAKSVRGVGMSDPPALAAGLAEKFDYTNTFYHQAPLLDITQPSPADLERYDFIVSSEVMEHVPPPVETAFANLYRMLKPDGLLLLTVPYRPAGDPSEHFPELHEYGLASVGGRLVLVNRRRDGSTEVFENLCFHGGHGSTVEMRVFSEESLMEAIRGAGFTDVHIALDEIPEFGVNHEETWSLPIVARKGTFKPPIHELAREYRDTLEKVAALALSHAEALAAVTATHAETESALRERLEWVRSLENELERSRAELARQVESNNRTQEEVKRALDERTAWAQSLKDELERSRAELARQVEFHNSSHEEMNRALDQRLEWLRKVENEFEERTLWARSLRKELDDVSAAHVQLEARRWMRLGRKLGFL